MKLYSNVFYAEIFSVLNGSSSSGRLFDSGFVFSSLREGDEVFMGPGEEASGNTSEDSTEAVGSSEVVMDGSGSEELHGHTMVGNSDSGVERGTGVGTSHEDHGSEGHGDGENTEHALVAFVESGEGKSLRVLADKIGHDEDRGTDELNPESLPFGDTSRSEMRELSSTLSGGSFLVFDEGVDGAGSKDTSDDLRDDHASSLGKVLQELVVVSVSFGQAESSVD